MKKLLLLIVAIVSCQLLSAQVTGEKVVGCSADCFFNDCMIRCPSGTMPRCRCIVGSFSSCGCSEVIGRAAIKNEQHIGAVLQFIKANKLTAFSVSFELLFKALKNNDQEEFTRLFADLEQLAAGEPDNARKIENFVRSLR